MEIYFWILLCILFSSVSIHSIKSYVNDGQDHHLILGLIGYIIIIISYVKILENGQELSRIYLVIQIIQIVVIFGIGIVYFKESLTYKKILGLVFCILAVYLLSV